MCEVSVLCESLVKQGVLRTLHCHVMHKQNGVSKHEKNES